MVDSHHLLPHAGRTPLLLMYIVSACPGTGQDGVDVLVWSCLVLCGSFLFVYPLSPRGLGVFCLVFQLLLENIFPFPAGVVRRAQYTL